MRPTSPERSERISSQESGVSPEQLLHSPASRRAICCSPPLRAVIRPLRVPSPEPPTHYEPPRFVPGTHLPELKGPQVIRSRYRPGGRRPIVARLRRADGRTYGRPDCPDLRSFSGRMGHSAFFADMEGMKRNAAQLPTFFTERSLAAYLSVSDRTIRNWIRRGELPSYKLGAARRIDPADVDRFLAERKDEAA
jgi:excisionase family DNA binding protein